MLVLTRKAEETIRIDDDIVIKVLRTKGNTVRLGIEAPSDKRVLRGEIAFECDIWRGESHEEEAATESVSTRGNRDQVTKALPMLLNNEAPLASFVAAAK